MPPDDEAFRRVDRMFDELMVKHFEMAGMIGEYRDLLENVRERPWDREPQKLVRSLPGARYHVSMSYVREQALKIEAELKKLLPEDE